MSDKERHMAKNIQLTATVDEDVKNESAAILQEIGLSMSSAIEIFLRQLIRHRGIPFDLTLGDPTPTKPQIDHEDINL